MSLKKPLVLYNGEPAQIQVGDDLDAPTSGAIEVTLLNANVAAVVICTPVYSITPSGSFDKANAAAAGTSKVIGLVSQAPSIGIAGSGPIAVGGVLAATTAQWDAVVTGGSGGLVFNTDYYLDITVGKLVTAAAAFIIANTTGNYLVHVGRGLSATIMEILIARRILF